jgi:hypothetical protein
VRNVNPSRLGLSLLTASALVVGTMTAADGAPTLRPGAARPVVFKRSALKLAARPRTTLTATEKAQVRAAIDKALEQFVKDKDARKFIAAGSTLGLRGEAAAVYQAAASELASTAPQQGAGGATAAGSAQTAGVAPPTYSIEAGEVVSATFNNPCAGDVVLSFTVKNSGAKPANGVTPRLVVDLSRTEPWAGHASAWVNLPSLAPGASATVQVPALSHRAASSNGACPTGDVIAVPTFVNVGPKSEYRLRIVLRTDGADATLSSGLFMSPEVAAGAGSGSGNGSGGGGIPGWLGGLLGGSGGCRTGQKRCGNVCVPASHGCR